MTANDRARVLQARTNEALDLYAGTLATAERLMSALAIQGTAPDDVARELLHYQQAAGPELLGDIADSGYRFLARSLLLAAEYGTDGLLRLVPAHRLPTVGPPPPPPVLPAPSDPAAWYAWFGIFAGWSVQHSTWAARVYDVIRGEVRDGALPPSTLREATDSLVRERLVDYLQDCATLQVELLTDGLTAGQHMVRSLLAALTDESDAEDLTIVVRGSAGSLVRTELALDNNRPDAAEVQCTTTSYPGFVVTASPGHLSLNAGQSATLTVVVDLWETGASGEEVPAGLVTVAGAGFGQLVVHVRAIVTPAPPRQLTVRVLTTGDEASTTQ